MNKSMSYFQGGIRSVVLVDAAQALILLSCMLVIVIRTVIVAGGFANILRLLHMGKRDNILL